MSILVRTGHASMRMSQRGIRIRDAELIALIGTEVGDGYLVLTRDCQRVDHELKQFLTRVWRLEGKRLVTVDGRIVTAYHASKRHERELLCDIHERDLA
jgi:hypothetical protein